MEFITRSPTHHLLLSLCVLTHGVAPKNIRAMSKHAAPSLVVIGVKKQSAISGRENERNAPMDERCDRRTEAAVGEARLYHSRHALPACRRLSHEGQGTRVTGAGTSHRDRH